MNSRDVTTQGDKWLSKQYFLGNKYSPANGASPWNSSTQSVELDNDTELSEPLDADAGDLFKSNLPEHLLYSYCVLMPLYHIGDAFNLHFESIFDTRRDGNDERISSLRTIRKSRMRDKRREGKKEKREIKFHNYNNTIYDCWLFSGSRELFVKHEKLSCFFPVALLLWLSDEHEGMYMINGLLIDTHVSKATTFSALIKGDKNFSDI